MRRRIAAILLLGAVFAIGAVTGWAIWKDDDGDATKTPITTRTSADRRSVSVSCPGDRDDSDCRRQVRAAVIQTCYRHRDTELVDVHIDATTLVTQGAFRASFIETERCADLLNPATGTR